MSDLLVGAVAGAAAVWVMDRVDWITYRNEQDSSRRRTTEVRPEGKDPADFVASQASEALGGGPLSQGHPAGLAVHYAIGIAPAALYGAMKGRVPGVDVGAGLGFGLAMFIAEDEVANPLLGIAAMPQRYPWQPHARGLIAHLVYGLVTDAVVNGVRPICRAGYDRGNPTMLGVWTNLIKHRTAAKLTRWIGSCGRFSRSEGPTLQQPMFRKKAPVHAVPTRYLGDTLAPRTALSAKIRDFSSSDHSRRRRCPVITSIRR